MNKTKCDIIRDIIATNEFCSVCAPKECSASTPCQAGQQCTGLAVNSSTNLLMNYCVGTPSACKKPNILIDPGLCDAPKYLDAKMRLFTNKFLSFGRDSTNAAMVTNDATLVGQVQQKLVNIYPNNASDIMSLKWPDIEKCIANPGLILPKGANPYFSRKDYNNLSSPEAKWKYPIGRQLGAGKVWKSTESPSFLPLYVDYLMNPDFAAILVLSFIVIIFTILMIKAHQKNTLSSKKNN